MRASGQQPGTQRTRCAPDFGKEKGRAAKLERGSSSPRSRPGAAAASAAAAAVPPCTGPRKAPPAPASPGEQPERPAAPRVTAAARVSPGAAGRALRAAPHPRAAGAACWRQPRGLGAAGKGCAPLRGVESCDGAGARRDLRRLRDGRAADRSSARRRVLCAEPRPPSGDASLRLSSLSWKGCGGKGPAGVAVPNSPAQAGSPRTRSRSRWLLNVSGEGDSTSPLGNLCQRQGHSRSERVFPDVRRRPLPLALPLGSTRKSPDLSSLCPPFRYLYTLARPPGTSPLRAEQLQPFLAAEMLQPP